MHKMLHPEKKWVSRVQYGHSLSFQTELFKQGSVTINICFFNVIEQSSPPTNKNEEASS